MAKFPSWNSLMANLLGNMTSLIVSTQHSIWHSVIRSTPIPLPIGSASSIDIDTRLFYMDAPTNDRFTAPQQTPESITGERPVDQQTSH